MAGISGRYDPASSIDYQGLLHNLQNWERSLLDEDKKFQAPDSGTRKKVSASENEVGNREIRVPAPEVNKPTSLVNNDSFQNRLSGVSDTISRLSGSLAPDDGIPDANSEKELQLNQSLQDIASGAASKAMISAVKNLKSPTTAYQFELSWRRFSDNPQLRESLLKTIPPLSLPQLFKNVLSASLLTSIIKCISTFFASEMELAISYIENLKRVQRFDMIIMSLPSNDKADLKNIWDNIFCKESVPETLNCLRAKYCPSWSDLEGIFSHGIIM